MAIGDEAGRAKGGCGIVDERKIVQVKRKNVSYSMVFAVRLGLPRRFYRLVGIFDLTSATSSNHPNRTSNAGESELTWNNRPSGEYVETSRSYPVPIDDILTQLRDSVRLAKMKRSNKEQNYAVVVAAIHV